MTYSTVVLIEGIRMEDMKYCNDLRDWFRTMKIRPGNTIGCISRNPSLRLRNLMTLRSNIENISRIRRYDNSSLSLHLT